MITGVARIDSPDKLRKWLEDCPANWAQVVATRVALRVVPFATAYSEGTDLPLTIFRAANVSWTAGKDPTKDITAAANAAARATAEAAAYAAYAANAADVANAARAANAAARGAANPDRAPNTAARGAADAAARAAEAAADSPSRDLIWQSITRDTEWLSSHFDSWGASRELCNQSLWLGEPPSRFHDAWSDSVVSLLKDEPSYSVWIEWYERRLRGERAAFNIPEDKDRREDKWILRKLSEAADSGFWDQGAQHVNQQLAIWLEEARKRVAKQEKDAPEPGSTPLIEIPVPIFGATAFALNSDGKLDPLPHYDQQHLRDLPNQRRAYIDVRSAALELQELGQRLGPKLTYRVDRFVNAFPEQFEDAEAWPIWSAAAALRTLYWKHKAVAGIPDPDDAKLDPAVAVELRGFLDIYNVFAFGDDGLRQKDEHSVSPQERLKVEKITGVSQPVQEAIIETIAIRTESTLSEIIDNRSNAELAIGTPYAEQTADQVNKITQNLAVGLLEGASGILTDPRSVGAELAKLGIKVGVTTTASAAAYAAFNHAALIEFIAMNAGPLNNYVTTVFQSYPHLPEIIDRIKLLWARLKSVI